MKVDICQSIPVEFNLSWHDIRMKEGIYEADNQANVVYLIFVTPQEGFSNTCCLQFNEATRELSVSGYNDCISLRFKKLIDAHLCLEVR